MNQDYSIVSWQDDIRSAGQFAAMKPVTETKPVQAKPDQDLWLCILAPDTAHHAGAGGLVDNIDQDQAALRRFAGFASASAISSRKGRICLATASMTGTTTELPNCL